MLERKSFVKFIMHQAERERERERERETEREREFFGSVFSFSKIKGYCY